MFKVSILGSSLEADLADREGAEEDLLWVFELDWWDLAEDCFCELSVLSCVYNKGSE